MRIHFGHFRKFEENRLCLGCEGRIIFLLFFQEEDPCRGNVLISDSLDNSSLHREDFVKVTDVYDESYVALCDVVGS